MPGLHNLGNTCFISCVLQALSASPSVQLAVAQELPFIPNKGLTCHLAQLLLRLRVLEGDDGVRGTPVSPAAVVQEMRAQHPSLGSQQQDAEEVLLIFVAALFTRDERYRPGALAHGGRGAGRGLSAIADLAEWTCNARWRQSIAIPPPCPDPQMARFILPAACRRAVASTGEQGARVRWGGWGGSCLVYHAGQRDAGVDGIALGMGGGADGSAGEPSLGNNPVMGLVSSGLACAACGGHREVKVDMFSDLSLSIGSRKPSPFGAVSLEDCLDAWAAPEALEGARCEHCLLAEACEMLRARKMHLAPVLETLPASRRHELLSAIDADLTILESFAPAMPPPFPHGRGPSGDGHAAGATRSAGGGGGASLSLPDVVRARCHKVVGDVPAGRIVKRLRVARAPPVLCLHLKRVIPTLSGFRKDRTPVVFGPTLSLAPFVETFQGDDEAPASKGTDDGKGPRYQLVAMVEHIGDAYSGHYICYARMDAFGSSLSDRDAYSGHYVCYARGSVGGGLNERWRLHNDSDSRDITLRDVLRREAYILVYDRVDV